MDRPGIVVLPWGPPLWRCARTCGGIMEGAMPTVDAFLTSSNVPAPAAGLRSLLPPEHSGPEFEMLHSRRPGERAERQCGRPGAERNGSQRPGLSPET